MICCFQSDLFDKQQQEAAGTLRLKGNAAVQEYTVQAAPRINIPVYWCHTVIIIFYKLKTTFNEGGTERRGRGWWSWHQHRGRHFHTTESMFYFSVSPKTSSDSPTGRPASICSSHILTVLYYFSHCKRGRYLPGQLTFSRPHVSDEEELVFALYYRLSKYSGFFFLGGWILNDGGMMNLFVKMVSCICGSLLKLGENLKDSVWNVLYPSKNQFDFHLIYDLPFLFCRDLFLPE